MKTATTNPSYTVIPAPENVDVYRDAITELWKNNLPIVSDRRFDWLYRLNPRGPARTWLVAGSDTGAVVGVGSLYPRTMVVDGKERSVGVAVDFAINKGHRVLGPALKIQKAIVGESGKHGFEFNYAFPSENSSAVFHRAGYRPIGEIQTCVKLLSVRKKMPEYCAFRPLAKTSSWTIDRYLRVRDLRRLRSYPPRNVALEILDRCDQRFDVLWQEGRDRYPVIGEKSAAFLNWRYADNTFDRYRFWSVLSSNRRQLKGFIVYNIRADVAFIADLFVIDDGGDVLPVMLLQFSEYLRKNQVSYITVSYFGNERLLARLRSIGFLVRQTKRIFYVYWRPSSDPGVVKTISDKANWFHFGGDLDLS